MCSSASPRSLCSGWWPLAFSVVGLRRSLVLRSVFLMQWLVQAALSWTSLVRPFLVRTCSSRKPGVTSTWCSALSACSVPFLGPHSASATLLRTLDWRHMVHLSLRAKILLKSMQSSRVWSPRLLTPVGTSTYSSSQAAWWTSAVFIRSTTRTSIRASLLLSRVRKLLFLSWWLSPVPWRHSRWSVWWSVRSVLVSSSPSPYSSLLSLVS